jgi:hypothetical protein
LKDLELQYQNVNQSDSVAVMLAQAEFKSKAALLTRDYQVNLTNAKANATEYLSLDRLEEEDRLKTIEFREWEA